MTDHFFISWGKSAVKVLRMASQSLTITSSLAGDLSYTIEPTDTICAEILQVGCLFRRTAFRSESSRRDCGAKSSPFSGRNISAPGLQARTQEEGLSTALVEKQDLATFNPLLIDMVFLFVPYLIAFIQHDVCPSIILRTLAWHARTTYSNE